MLVIDPYKNKESALVQAPNDTKDTSNRPVACWMLTVNVLPDNNALLSFPSSLHYPDCPHTPPKLVRSTTHYSRVCSAALQIIALSPSLLRHARDTHYLEHLDTSKGRLTLYLCVLLNLFQYNGIFIYQIVVNTPD